MKSYLLLPAFLAFLVFPVLCAHAEEKEVYEDNDNGTTYDLKTERYKVPFDAKAMKDAATNVVVKEIPFEKLPEDIANQVTTYSKECVEGEDTIKLMKYYRYVSDRNRSKNLSPNYLIDTRPLYALTQKTCIIGNICEKQGCHLLGYSATDYEKWDLQKSTRIFAWTIQQAMEPKRKDPIGYFQLTLQQECKEEEQSTGCVKNYIWSARGFVPYDLSAATAPQAPAAQAPAAAE